MKVMGAGEMLSRALNYSYYNQRGMGQVVPVDLISFKFAICRYLSFNIGSLVDHPAVLITKKSWKFLISIQTSKENRLNRLL